MEKDLLQKQTETSKLVVKDGWLICPACRRRKILRVREDTYARRLTVYCRACHAETIVDIEQGQCSRSQSR